MPTCIFRVRPNSLLSLWYTLGSTFLQSWLLYLGFERYRLYMEMQWPTGGYPRVWLTVYIALLGSCIPLLALFLAFGLLKSGNLASDNERLGARPKRTIELVKGGMGQTAVRLRNSNAYRLCHCLRSVWLHCPPMAQSLHILLALIQLFAQQTILAQLYRWGFINSGDFLNTEVDWLFQRARQLATNLPMGETRLQSFRISTDELAASPVAPNVLPILMHTRLFGIPLEFVNLLIALIAFSSVYPSVFWRASKSFSLCFSAFLAIHSLNLVWTYLGFSVLFRIQETNFYGGRPVGMGQHLWALRSLPLFHPLAIVISFWLTVVLIQLAPVALYSFGYGKFAAAQQRLRCQRRSSIIQPTSAGGGCSLRGGGPRDERTERDVICDGYAPHVIAIALLLVIALVKAPAFYAIGLIYQKEERPLLLWCLVADLAYLFCWILLWLLHTVKCQWQFRVHFDLHELIALQDAHKTAEGHALDGRGPGELKNALMLVHGADLFITDDPVAKPAIMRQVLKSCLPTEDIPPAWLRSTMMPSGIGAGSVPATQSPQRRLIMPSGNAQRILADQGPVDFGFRTPDLGYLRCQQQHQQMLEQYQHDLQAVNDQRSSSPSTVPLAAPPYQRMASLPPMMPPQISSGPQATNGFGTLQRSQRPSRSAATSNNYTSFMREHQQQLVHVPQQQTYQDTTHPPISATTNYSLGTLTRSYESGRNPAGGNQIPMAPESYATIHRRCSKSSVGSGFAAPSPQLMRSNRSASLVKATEVQQQQQYGQQIYGQYNGTARRAGAGTGMVPGAAQQPQQNGGQPPPQQQQQNSILLNGISDQPKPAVVVPIIQRQRPSLGPSTFAGGIWQPDGTHNGTTAEGGSINGTTPSGSVTLGGDSRVASAASSNASSAARATFDLVAPQLNGTQQMDSATLTRESLREAEGTQWKGRNGAGGKLVTRKDAEEFATSVV